MTYHVIEEMVRFLNNYTGEFSPKTKVADYGGSIADCQGIAKDMVRASLSSGGMRDYHILDFNTGYDLAKPIKGPKYDMGICIDVLEHTKNPFIVAKNICNNLKKGALLYITAPWVWPLHYHPLDCWRFSEQGLIELFKEHMVIEKVFMTQDCLEEEKELFDYPNRTIGWLRKK